MKKMKETNKILLNLPASGRRKAFKSSDPADALSNPLQRPSKAAILFFSLAITSFINSNIFSLYVNLKSSLKLTYPSFSVNLSILTVTLRGVWLTVTMKKTDNYHYYIPRLSLTKRVLWLVDSRSCAPDQIQMYPDWDIIVQLLYSIPENPDFVSGNIKTLRKTKLFPSGPYIKCIMVHITPKDQTEKLIR